MNKKIEGAVVLSVLFVILVSGISNAKIYVGSDYVSSNSCAWSSLLNNYAGSLSGGACVLNTNIYESIEITTNNTILDCAGKDISAVGTYGIYLEDKINSTVKNCNVNGFYKGLLDLKGVSNSILNNTFFNNTFGISIYYAKGDVVNYNIIRNIIAPLVYVSDRKAGFDISSTNNSNFSFNTISENTVGLTLAYNKGCLFANNTILNHPERGINIWGDTNDVFTGNIIRNNSEAGIVMSYSTNNSFYLNLFNNTYNVQIGSGVNYWNSSTAGNKWFTPTGWGYSEVCWDINLNGICDGGYNISGLYGPNIVYPNLAIENNTDYKASAAFLDADNDGVPGKVDNCPSVANSNQSNLDGYTPPGLEQVFWSDSLGDACDYDIDGDLIANEIDRTGGLDASRTWSNNYNDTHLGGGAKTFGRRTNNVTETGMYVQINDSAGNGVKATVIWGSAMSSAQLISCNNNATTTLSSVGASATISCASATVTADSSPVPGAVAMERYVGNGVSVKMNLDTGEVGYFGDSNELSNHGQGALDFSIVDSNGKSKGIGGILHSEDIIDINSGATADSLVITNEGSESITLISRESSVLSSGESIELSLLPSASDSSASYTDSSSSGGGGGGGSDKCSSDWNCSVWGVCSDSGNQTRICSLVKPGCSALTEKPSELQACSAINQTTSQTKLDGIRSKVVAGVGGLFAKLADSFSDRKLNLILAGLVIVCITLIVILANRNRRIRILRILRKITS